MSCGSNRRPRRVLLLAYMFPPIVDAGGFRPLAFSRYLPDFGYEPIVLTRPDSGNLPVDPSQLDTLPPSVRVVRVARGFADGWNDYFRQRLGWLGPLEALVGKPAGWIADGVAWRAARRDDVRRWEVVWMQPAVDLGRTLIERHKPHAIVATAPPFETLKAGLLLHQRTGVPLIADFRDPWTYGVLWKPQTGRRARREAAWEAQVVHQAAKVLVVTPSMRRAMIAKYPAASNKVALVMNGFDDFHQTDACPPQDRFVLSYVGSIMERRFPPVLFEALRRLRDRHPDTATRVRVQFIGPNQCPYSLDERLRAEGLSETVEYLGPVGHDRCREMMRASHVLLHIETVADYAVSSKLFEYFAANRPILGIVPRGSDDEWFLQQSGVGRNAGIGDADAIASAIYGLWRDWRDDRRSVPSVDVAWLAQYHRREQVRHLAKLLDETSAG